MYRRHSSAVWKPGSVPVAETAGAPVRSGAGTASACLWIAGVLGLLAIPFLAFGWYSTHDGLTYPVRAAEWSYLYASGDRYPRWAASFYWGFGYPIFNFFPPLVYFLSHLLMQAGLTAPVAVRVLELSAFLTGFAGCYRLARLWASPRIAFAAAIAGMLAPYRLVDVYVRGDLAESFAFGLVPFVLAEAVVLGRNYCTRAGFRLALFLALVFYSHTLTSFMCSLALAAMGLYALVRGRWQVFVSVGLWSGLGLLLSAACWIPAYFEHGLVNVKVATEARDFYSYHWADHFLEWWQQLDPSWGIGPSLPGPGDRMNFSASVVLVAAAVYAAGRLRTASGRLLYGPVLAALLVTGLLTIGLSKPLWSVFPLMHFFQFPWRFLLLETVTGTALIALVLTELVESEEAVPDERSTAGPAGGVPGAGWLQVAALVLALGVAAIWFNADPELWQTIGGLQSARLALVAGLGLALLAAWRLNGAVAAAAAAAVLAATPNVISTLRYAQETAIPAERIRDNPSFTSPVFREQTSLRRHDGVIEPLQTTGTDEFLPLGASRPPEELRGKVQFRESDEGTSYRLLEQLGSYRHWEIVSPRQQDVLLPVFDFPGWSVFVDDIRVIHGSGPDGLIRVQVPGRISQVSMRYTGTQIQAGSELLSIVAIILWGGGWLWYEEKRRQRSRHPPDVSPPPPAP